MGVPYMGVGWLAIKLLKKASDNQQCGMAKQHRCLILILFQLTPRFAQISYVSSPWKGSKSWTKQGELNQAWGVVFRAVQPKTH